MARLAVVALALAVGCRAAPPPPPPHAPPPPPAPVEPVQESTPELKELRAKIAELAERSADLKRDAHEALDQGRYEDAAALHRESADAARAAERGRGAERGLVQAAAKRLIGDLDHEEIGVREAATRGLLELDPEPSLLQELAVDLGPEATRRIDLVLQRLVKGFNGRQWASGATASTEYGNSSWAASQATGAPNTPQAGDCSTAWASRMPDADSEWLTLTFETAVEPTLIRIHETYNAGAISKVEAKDATGAWRTVWEGPAAACETPRWFEVSVPAGKWTTREVRIALDSDAVPGWNEIDAVELVGRDPLRARTR